MKQQSMIHPYLISICAGSSSQKFMGSAATLLVVCMMQTSFNKLLGYIHDDLRFDSEMASLCGSAILPESQLYCTLLVGHTLVHFSLVFPLSCFEITMSAIVYLLPQDCWAHHQCPFLALCGGGTTTLAGFQT
jgi:hypothetical protein